LPDLYLTGALGLRLAAVEWMTAAGAWRRHVDGTGGAAASCASCAAGTLCNAGRALAVITDRKTGMLILAADIALADLEAAARRDDLLATALALHGAIYGGIQGKLL
jgi:hypothetical protein